MREPTSNRGKWMDLEELYLLLAGFEHGSELQPCPATEPPAFSLQGTLAAGFPICNRNIVMF